MSKPERKHLSVQEVDALVTAYKNGTPGASEQLVDAFEGFIVKFLNLISKGECDLNDTALRNFLSLYAGATVHQFRHNLAVRTEAYKMIGLLEQQFSLYDREEIKNELIVVFLNMARRYKSPQDSDPYFHTYVQKVFGYHVNKALAKLTADSLTYANGSQNSSYDDNESGAYQDEDHEVVEVDNTESTNPAAQSYKIDETLENDDSYLDENWINGMSASQSFQMLDPLDRRILKLYYIDELDDYQIADALGTCRATVNRRRMAAEQGVYRDREASNLVRSDEEYIARVFQEVNDRSRSERIRGETMARAVRKIKRWKGNAA